LLLIKPYLALLPGAVVFVLVMGINLLGDALRDALDPRLSTGQVGRASGVTSVVRPVPVSSTPLGTNGHGGNSLLEVRDLTVEFQRSKGTFEAARSVDLQIARGATLGLVGESGSGKSVTAHALTRLLPSPPASITSGNIRFAGSDLLAASGLELRRLRGNRVAYVFQDPLTMLNPMFTVGEQIAEVIRLHRECTRQEAWEEAVQWLDRLRIPEARARAQSYPHELSGGMRQRVGLAIALANRPDLLIADEPTTALDVTVQRVVIDLIREQIRRANSALLFISHDLALVADLCEQVLVMKDGEIVERGQTRDVLAQPAHAYTQKLIDSLPSADWPPVVEEDDGRKAVFDLQDVRRDFRSFTGGWFGRGGDVIRALRKVSFSISDGSTFGIVGESGSGKSTLARILCGLLPASSGKIDYDGTTIDEWMNPAREYRRRVQMVFQDPTSSLNPRLRVRSILRQPLRALAGIKERREQEQAMRKLMNQTGLPLEALDRFPHEFSGGQAQRIGIARALAAKPSVLVLDEAVSALDVSMQAQILDLLRELRDRERLTMIFISHDLAVVRELCTHVAVLKEGRLVECGRTGEVFESPQQEYTRRLLESRVELPAHNRVRPAYLFQC
jgi:peptide/nickel transport system ATP-binding protein